MTKNKIVDLRTFRTLARTNRTRYRRFLTKLEKGPTRGIGAIVAATEKKVWKEVDCLSCANCCKTMTPTFTRTDVNRIARHFEMTSDAFRVKWLKQERSGDRDWVNKKQGPCQFLNLKDNKCSIYSVRPADCSGFPHLAKDFHDFVHIHKQNVEYCPASYKLVEKMYEAKDLWVKR